MLINRKSYEESNNKQVPIEKLEKQALAHLRPLVMRAELSGMPAEEIVRIVNLSTVTHPSIFHQHFSGIAHVENAVTVDDVIAALKG